MAQPRMRADAGAAAEHAISRPTDSAALKLTIRRTDTLPSWVSGTTIATRPLQRSSARAALEHEDPTPTCTRKSKPRAVDRSTLL
jgi:hypothetical protein